MSQNTEQLLKTFGFTGTQFPRIRDARINANHLIVTTKTGAENRKLWESEESRREATPVEFTEPNPPNGPWHSQIREYPGYAGDKPEGELMHWYFRPVTDAAKALLAAQTKND